MARHGPANHYPWRPARRADPTSFAECTIRRCARGRHWQIFVLLCRRQKCYTNMQEINLSERDVIGYTKRLYPNDWDKAAYNVVYACNNGVINESTLPYIEPYVDSVPDIRPIGWDLIKPSYYNIIN